MLHPLAICPIHSTFSARLRNQSIDIVNQPFSNVASCYCKASCRHFWWRQLLKSESACPLVCLKTLFLAPTQTNTIYIYIDGFRKKSGRSLAKTPFLNQVLLVGPWMLMTPQFPTLYSQFLELDWCTNFIPLRSKLHTCYNSPRIWVAERVCFADK